MLNIFIPVSRTVSLYANIIRQRGAQARASATRPLITAQKSAFIFTQKNSLIQHKLSFCCVLDFAGEVNDSPGMIVYLQ